MFFLRQNNRRTDGILYDGITEEVADAEES